ncbi:nucleotidyltransferase domain-containing protein [Pseudomonas sp. efr-133-TYG-103a]|uniref:nucleotidyltransferase domain-containing protein n=1 Tax=Pseudomonas sp. efr-133-TYG-103a TaxID=3040308 RepID=UPI0025548D22|nr:nucleotidyltransferase domain-containing protein [Pseudomonas sp. efr-133-TYG-103a]
MSIADALFTITQQRLLGLLYGHPERSFYTNEIRRWAQVGTGSMARELARLQAAGLLTATRQGNQVHYQANPANPVYEELLAIVRKTFGIADHLRLELLPFADRLQRAFIYGSIAKGTANTSSDIDLMLIGEGLRYSEVMERMMPLEEILGRTINPTLYTPADWQAKFDAGNSFVVRVSQQEKIDIIGSD